MDDLQIDDFHCLKCGGELFGVRGEDEWLCSDCLSLYAIMNGKFCLVPENDRSVDELGQKTELDSLIDEFFRHVRNRN